MDSTYLPHTQRSLIFGLVVGVALLIWNFALAPAEQSGQARALEQTTLPAGEIETTTTPVAVSQISVESEVAVATATPSPAPPPDTPVPPPAPRPLIHAIERGEMLGSIAGRYGVTVARILALNNIDDPTLLQIGQELVIPATPTPTATPKNRPTPTPEPVRYSIQSGDTLLEIAAAHDTTVEAIMIVNGILNPRSLQIGREIIIPPDRGSILGVPTLLHEITGGDTLLTLAAQYGSTVEDILATNPDLEPRLLSVGQQLIIPLTQPRAARNAAPGPPLAPRVTSPDPLPAGLAGLSQQMINGVNAQRQAHRLPALSVDEALTLSAQAHAQDMIARGYFSHVTPEGVNLRDRLTAQGLDLNWTGENIQRNVQPYDQSARYALTWFMNSRVHRANILHPHYTRFGVGVVEGPPEWYSYVLVFGGG